VAPGADNDKARESDSTDGDFDKMISDLKNNGTTLPGGAASAAAPAAPEPAAPAPQADSGDMTDAEFESLMDQLHGKGKGPGSEGDKAALQSPAAPASAGGSGSLASKDIQTAPKAAPAAAPAAETTVRVNTKVLDTIMNMVGELVLVRNRLVNINANKSDPEMNKAISNLDVVTADLQSAVMKTRMQPVKKVFGRFPRVVRDLARKLHKNIELKMVGEDTDLDKNLVDALADPMVHMVRNSCDHGIEEPEVRARAGKPEVGTITLAASQQGDHILLTISDDGAGMEPAVLKQVAMSRGVIDEETAQRMTDEEAFNLIFAPGFSTNKVVTDISGRGVGMDVVKTSIAKLNGSLKIDSKVGVGTTISIKVPLTLAILPTLMVQVGSQPFAIPLTSVSEIFSLELGRNVKVVDGQPTIVIREKAIALFYLEDWLVKPEERSHPDKGYVVIVQCAAQQVAFVVDGLIGQEEVVIKPLDDLLHKTPGLAGATITSDGGIALILDIPNLLKSYAHRH
jgi:two-component system chemotaxis sensor kinase CheA